MLSRGQSRTVLAAATKLHGRFPGEAVLGLCSLVDLYATFARYRPARAGRSQPNPEAPRAGMGGLRRNPFPPVSSSPCSPSLRGRRCWRTSLLACDCTLIHGDLKLGNLGFFGDPVVMLDWGNWTGMAPPPVELAHMAVNWSAIEASREEIIEDFRLLGGDHHDELALRLA